MFSPLKLLQILHKYRTHNRNKGELKYGTSPIETRKLIVQDIDYQKGEGNSKNDIKDESDTAQQVLLLKSKGAGVQRNFKHP